MAESGTLHVEVCQDASRRELLLVLRGDVCILTVGTLRRALDAALAGMSGRITLDLTEVGVFGAAGVGELARAAELARTAGGCMTIRAARPVHRRVLETTGFAWLLEAPAGEPGRGSYSRAGEMA